MTEMWSILQASGQTSSHTVRAIIQAGTNTSHVLADSWLPT